jgi:zinc finger protein 830
MADVRSLLRNERNARRISHPHATYSTTGTLVCLVCHIQLKSESLWNGHLRSAQHAMRLQRIRDGTLGRPPGAPAPESQQVDHEEEEDAEDSEPAKTTSNQTNGISVAKSNKRKADDGEERVRKRSRADGLPEGFFDEGAPNDSETTPPQTSKTSSISGQEIQLPSRPATPLKAPEVTMVPKPAMVDEDEWAAFEADIAAAEASAVENVVISAPAMSAAELVAKSKEEEIAQKKERQEAELEGDKEDAARKLEDEFEEMEALEERIRKLKEKREALRLKASGSKTAVSTLPQEAPPPKLDAAGINGKPEDGDDDDEDEDEDEDDDDDWDGFRLKA